MKIVAPRMTGDGQASQGFTDHGGAGLMISSLRAEPFALTVDEAQLHLLVEAGLRLTLVREGNDDFRLQIEELDVDLSDDDDEDFFDDLFDDDDYDPFEDDEDIYDDDFTI